ncbi:hypothetical protein BGZ95_003400 [Linnemannia exigua]|uniref:Alcohol acetyltransferase n=1 Tax=Linnemannia exigua TaxID=604196 RepID=A0AAD4D4S4_9FUNG|nr:hypothetical protein BGZ95_003400 [Linnemannia exigua]
MSLPLVRKVSGTERYSVARANTLIYMNVVVGARLHELSKTGTSSQPRDHAQWVQLLTGPLTWLIQEHPNLSVVVGDHLSATPVFLQMASVDLSRVIRVTSIDRVADINKVLEEEHGIHFDFSNTELPLWRTVVVQVKEDGSFYVLHVYQHCIADGRAGLGVVEQLIEQLNIQAVAADEPYTLPSVVVIPSTLRAMPPPLEEIINCSPSPGLLIKEGLLALFLPASVKRALEKKYWSGEFDATLKVPNETEVVAMYLTKEETAQVAQSAKAHKTTVHAILLGAAAFATKAVFLSNSGDNQQDPTTTKMGMKLTTPVTLRPIVKPALTNYVQGNFTSEIASKDIKVKLDTGIWDLAYRFKKQLVAETTKPRPLLGHVGLLDYLPKETGGWEKFLTDQVKKEQHGREATLQISNLGIGLKQDQKSTDSTPAHFKVLDAMFSQASSITAASFTFSVVTANGVLAVTSSWQKSAFTGRDRGELHMREFKRILLEATQLERKDYRFREVFGASPTTAAAISTNKAQ